MTMEGYLADFGVTRNLYFQIIFTDLTVKSNKGYHRLCLKNFQEFFLFHRNCSKQFLEFEIFPMNCEEFSILPGIQFSCCINY